MLPTLFGLLGAELTIVGWRHRPDPLGSIRDHLLQLASPHVRQAPAHGERRVQARLARLLYSVLHRFQ